MLVTLSATDLLAQDGGGSVRGMVYDDDFDTPLADAEVLIAETGQKTLVTEQGNFLIENVAPGIYTLVFSKEGYTRRVKGDVVVTAGKMTEIEASLFGEFTDMEEFIVQEVETGSKTEIALLALRMESPALMNSISADLMSQAGASDAASALNLVSGATVSEGKFAVIRGLPDRYVNSQMNGVRLPTADTDKRAVELDLFPAAAIDSINVSKTFTPDQQGDASGGAVNVILKGIPEETVFKISGGSSYNSQFSGGDDFLSSRDGGPNFLGMDDIDIPMDMLGENWDGPVGVSRTDAPTDYKWSMFAGGKYDFGNAIKIGGLVSAFYERDSSFYDDGVDDKYWVEEPGGEMTPQSSQGTPEQEDFKTSLFDVTQGSEEVKWGGLGVLGAETENNKLTLTYLYTRVAESVATLAEDTRGKEFYYPGYDPDDPTDPGNAVRNAAPYLRLETLEYTERTANTIQLRGEHTLPIPEPELGKIFKILRPEFDWTVSRSTADLYQPDKRQFGTIWYAPYLDPGFPPYIPPYTTPPEHRPYKPAANFTLGNLQRIWKEISEESDQYAVNLKFPFRQWTGDEGYFKVGYFNDEVVRLYNQDSYSNFNDNAAFYEGDWDDFWSEQFPDENHPISEALIDVDYEGLQNISAYYYMADIPLTSFFRVIGGMRFERTELSIINTPEADVTWIPPGATGPVTLNPGDADVMFEQDDELPSIGFVLTPIKSVAIRGSYSETVARQTFKELTPIQQQEFLGGDVFIGNPELQMSSVKNYDLRLDYTPYEGGLISVSYFKKDITNPIEYVQRINSFAYTTAVNYPEGTLSGYELEFRQDVGHFHDLFKGLTVGANATFIDSEVTLPDEESEGFESENIKAPMKTRHMTNAPEHLYNLYATYNMEKLRLPGTTANIFYTVRGDTLVAGAGQSQGNFIPDVYETEYGTLNFSLSQKIGEGGNITFQAKNLLDPAVETVYRSEYLDKDVTKTSYHKGIEFSLGLSYSISRTGKKEDNDFGPPTYPDADDDSTTETEPASEPSDAQLNDATDESAIEQPDPEETSDTPAAEEFPLPDPPQETELKEVEYEDSSSNTTQEENAPNE